MMLMVSAFATVFLLVFQQQNVTHRQYGLAALTSALITITQFARKRPANYYYPSSVRTLMMCPCTIGRKGDIDEIESIEKAG